MASTEMRVSPFSPSISNQKEPNINALNKEENIINNNVENAQNNLQNGPKTGLKAFLTSKKGIIILSVIGIVVIAAVASAVIATQVIGNKSDIENKSDQNDNKNETNNGNPENEDDNSNESNDELDTDDTTGIENSIFAKEKTYTEPLLSLSQNNLIQYEYLGQENRDVPKEIKTENIASVFPSYGGDNTNADAEYDKILEENKKIMASSTTYDEIDSNGNLYLNGELTGNKIYKHSSSIGLYGGNISDEEKSVIKKLKINPISAGNYITGLYAPPGEVIKVEISEEDLKNIGGSLKFVIGQATQQDGYSENKEIIGLKRMPILVNFITIKKTPGYIGSFIGGPIYISNPDIKRIFTVTIYNAVPYKHLIFGVTTKEEFEQMENFTAPFAELDVRDSIRYSGPAEIIEGLDYENLVQNLIFWDKCVRTSRKIPNGAKENLGIHFLFDPCVNAKNALALAYVGNNWCQVPLGFKLALNYETVTKYGAWGHIHELNHHFQYFGFSESVSNEVTNNVVNLIEYIIYSQISGLRNEYSNSAITTISNNHLYLNPEHALSLLISAPPSKNTNEIKFYEPILQTFGYDKFIEVARYGNKKGGVDLFCRALTNILHYDFIYYIEKMLNLTINETLKEEIKREGYPIFIPVSSIYQTGKYFDTGSGEIFSNTSLPYRIPGGGPTKLNLDKHILVPTGFTYEIEEITDPEHGTLTQISDKVYSFTPDDNYKLSGIINLKVKVTNSEESIETNVKLGLNFEIDNTQSVETDYIYDTVKYTSIFDAINSKFEGYSGINYFPNYAGKISDITEGNIGVWEGKFKIKDEGYKYILHKGGRGNSVLYIKINDEEEYRKISEIDINQSNYQFNAKAHYQIDLNVGDIIYFKMYLLAKDTNNGKASVVIGISKTDNPNTVKTLGSSDIVGLREEFDKKYVFFSGDPYKVDKEFDSYSFFDYTLVKLTSPNFKPWDDSGKFDLNKIIDRKDDTYMHTKRGEGIKESNPLTLIFDLGKKYFFDYISIKKGGNNFYLPKKVFISISQDGENWENEEQYITSEKSSSVDISLNNKIYTKFIKLHITEATQTNPGYIAIKSIDFIELGIKYYQKTPEFPEIGGNLRNIEINFDNFPYFGHSYILNKGNFLNFNIDNIVGIQIKVCNKFDSEIALIIDNKTEDIEIFTIKAEEELDYPIIKKELIKGNHCFRIEVKEGKFDFEYILYQL